MLDFMVVVIAVLFVFGKIKLAAVADVVKLPVVAVILVKLTVVGNPVVSRPDELTNNG